MSEPGRWIAVDWGTSKLRAWLMEAGVAIDHASSDAGMATLSRADFEPALIELIDRWLPAGTVTQIVACGMVGARLGWREAPYVPVPCGPLEPQEFVIAPSDDPRLSVRLIHGICQNEPADVMRGEETQLAGLLREESGFEGTVCLPGTHSKWASLRAGRVETFITFMTGELFALLDRQSVLRHVTGDGEDWQAYEDGVAAMLCEPAGLTARLFGIRAEALLAGLEPAAAQSRLSGLLIGAEIAAARRKFQGNEIVVIGSDALAHRYKAALELAGFVAVLKDATALTLAGLTAARTVLQSRR